MTTIWQRPMWSQGLMFAPWPFTEEVRQPMSLIGIRQRIQYQRKEGRENCEMVTWEHFETPTLSPIVILQISSFDAEVSF